MVVHYHLLSSIQTMYTHVYLYVGRWGWKEGEREGPDSCLTLLTLLMDPKLDCQKLRHCPGKYFFVGSSISTKSMSQNHIKHAMLEIKITVLRAWQAVRGVIAFQSTKSWH